MYFTKGVPYMITFIIFGWHQTSLKTPIGYLKENIFFTHNALLNNTHY